MKKIFGIFDRRPLIWFHYILLTGVLFGAFFSASALGIVSQTMTLSTAKWIGLFVFYFAFLSIGDQIIHTILRVD